jgi:hypothetical protein
MQALLSPPRIELHADHAGEIRGQQRVDLPPILALARDQQIAYFSPSENNRDEQYGANAKNLSPGQADWALKGH